jgi:AcrR family transcriptional regulator
MIPRRERLRQTTIDEIKTIAWELLKTHGAITINRITQQMGMTAPAFYSYFKSRDQLMEHLIMDSLDSFQGALIAARDRAPASDIPLQMIHTLLGYREWAVANPIAFGLFAGRKVYGFDPVSQTISATAQKGYRILFDLFDTAWQKSLIQLPKSPVLPLPYKQQMLNLGRTYGLSSPEELIHFIVQTLALVHGLISLELSSRFTPVIEDGSVLFKFQILTALDPLGLHSEGQDNTLF